MKTAYQTTKWLWLTCFFDTGIRAKRHAYAHIKDYGRADDTTILDFLEMSLGEFENESKHESVQQLWKRFKEIIRYCSDSFIPTRVKKTKRRNPWISRKIIHMKRKIKRLRRTDKASTEMSCVKKNLKVEIAQSKEHFLNNTLTNFLKNSPRKFWLFFKEANEGIDLIVDGKEAITEKSDIAGRLNQFFQSVFCKDQGTTKNMNRVLQ